MILVAPFLAHTVSAGALRMAELVDGGGVRS